jgi:hypothetical protein
VAAAHITVASVDATGQRGISSVAMESIARHANADRERRMFVLTRRISRAERWFRIIVFVLLLPYSAFTMHWAVEPKNHARK